VEIVSAFFAEMIRAVTLFPFIGLEENIFVNTNILLTELGDLRQ